MTTTLEVIVELQRGGVALHLQLEAALRAAIREGRLAPGAPLPPTRELAADLDVSRGVVVEAYAQLAAEGYLVSRPGSYTRVAAVPRPAAAAAAAEPRSDRHVVDFSPCRADGSLFPRAAWLRSMRRVLERCSGADFGYTSGRGALPLREALAAYLNRVRGAAARPENVVICNGYAQGISLLIGVLASRGATTIAVEDPCADDDAVPAARAAGLEVVGVPVGEDGIRIEALEAIEADALVLTPSHQWPLGGVLPAPARVRALAWARRTGALIVEDDYDAEYRYDQVPLAALQGLDPDRVVYAGTASKTLAPGLRLGWLVAPPGLVDDLACAKELADRGSPVIEQLAFADFLAAGALDRHLRRMRPVYRRRRAALIRALERRAPELRPRGISAGLHLAAGLPGDVPERAVIAAAAQRGVALHGLEPYRLTPSEEGGLLFGYGTLSEPELEFGVAALAEAIHEVR